MSVQLAELAAGESNKPDCSHVKDFRVGRHGYGSVKFDIGQSGSCSRVRGHIFSSSSIRSRKCELSFKKRRNRCEEARHRIHRGVQAPSDPWEQETTCGASLQSSLLIRRPGCSYKEIRFNIKIPVARLCKKILCS